MSRTRAFNCEVCSQPTSRLYGVMAGVEMPGHVQSGQSAVLGYCARHKDEVVPGFLASLASQGETRLLTDPPAELRPAEADAFLVWADRTLSGAISEFAEVDTVLPLANSSEVPERCPHCNGQLSWGTGPHLREAGQRPGAVAWECLECGAAGMLFGAPAE
jgi:hypothetical protein